MRLGRLDPNAPSPFRRLRLIFPSPPRGEGPGNARPFLLPSLEGRGWGWVGVRTFVRAWLKLADPPPTPPFQGGGKVTHGGGGKVTAPIGTPSYTTQSCHLPFMVL